MGLEEALTALRSAFSRDAILEHWAILETSFMEELADTNQVFTEWVFESQRIERSILRLVGDTLFEGFYEKQPSENAALLTNLRHSLELDSHSVLCLGLGKSVAKSRDSLRLLTRLTKKRPEISFREILLVLGQARNTYRKAKQGSKKDRTQFAPEDVKNAMKILFPQDPAQDAAVEQLSHESGTVSRLRATSEEQQKPEAGPASPVHGIRLEQQNHESCLASPTYDASEDGQNPEARPASPVRGTSEERQYPESQTVYTPHRTSSEPQNPESARALHAQVVEAKQQDLETTGIAAASSKSTQASIAITDDTPSNNSLSYAISRPADQVEDTDSDDEREWVNFASGLLKGSQHSEVELQSDNAIHSVPENEEIIGDRRHSDSDLPDADNSDDDAISQASEVRYMTDSHSRAESPASGVLGDVAEVGFSDVERGRRVCAPSGAGYDFDDETFPVEGNLPNSVTMRKNTAGLRSPPHMKALPLPQPSTGLVSWSDDQTIQIGASSVGAKDFETSTANNWLNDEIINACTHLLFFKRRDTHFTSTFFFTNLAGGKQYLPGREIDYASVHRWTKNVDIFQLKYLVIPINRGNYHWSLAIVRNLSSINTPAFEITTMDSMDHIGNEANASIASKLAAYLIAKGETKICDKHITKKHVTTLPQQPNGWDCGVYVVAYLSRFANDPQAFFYDIKQLSIDTWGVDARQIRAKIQSCLLSEKAKATANVTTVSPQAAVTQSHSHDLSTGRQSTTTTDLNSSKHPSGTIPKVTVASTQPAPIPAYPRTQSDTATDPDLSGQDGPARFLDAFSSPPLHLKAGGQQTSTVAINNPSDQVLAEIPGLESVSRQSSTRAVAKPSDHRSAADIPRSTTGGACIMQLGQTSELSSKAKDDVSRENESSLDPGFMNTRDIYVLHHRAALEAIAKVARPEIDLEVQQSVIQRMDSKDSVVVSKDQWAFVLQADVLPDFSPIIGKSQSTDTKNEDLLTTSLHAVRKRHYDLSAQEARKLEHRLIQNEEKHIHTQQLAQLLSTALQTLEAFDQEQKHSIQALSQELSDEQELQTSGLTDARFIRHREKWIKDIDSEMTQIRGRISLAEQARSAAVSLYKTTLTMYRNTTLFAAYYMNEVQAAKAAMEEFIEQEIASELEREKPWKRLQQRLGRG